MSEEYLLNVSPSMLPVLILIAGSIAYMLADGAKALGFPKEAIPRTLAIIGGITSLALWQFNVMGEDHAIAIGMAIWGAVSADQTIRKGFPAKGQN